LVPFKCCYNRRDKLVHAAEAKTKEELKIIGWIQFMRCTEVAMGRLFSEQDLAEIKKEASFRTITLDDDKVGQDD